MESCSAIRSVAAVPVLRLLAALASATLAAFSLYWALHGSSGAVSRHLLESAGLSDVEVKFSQHLGKNVVALLLTLAVGSIASAAGTGGGAFFVPLFNYLVGFTVKGATALSQATITGGSLAAVAICLTKTHPVDPSKPLIDYTLSLMLLPVLLLGVSLGVLANKLFPNWLITFQLIVLLTYLTYLTAKKATKLHNAERRAAKVSQETELQAYPDEGNAGQAAPCHDVESPRLEDSCLQGAAASADSAGPAEPPSEGSLDCGSPDFEGNVLPADEPGSSHEHSPTHSENSRRQRGFAEGSGRDSKRLPWLQILQMLALWAVFLVLQLLKTRFSWCSVPFIVIYVLQTCFCICANSLFIWQILRSQQSQPADVMSQPILDDMYPVAAWTLLGLLRVSVVTLVAGTVAGLLGIGGGMIVGPLLLELGVHPMISAATSSLMVLFSASSAMLSFGFDGALNIQFALIFGLSCLGASLVGVGAISRLVKKSGKASILVILLAGIIGAGAILTAALGGRAAVLDLSNGHNIIFSSFCSPH